MLASVSPNFSSVLSEWLSSVTGTSTVSARSSDCGLMRTVYPWITPASSIFLMRPQQGDALRPTACPISCRLARALPCSTARIFLSSRSIGWIIHQSSTTQKIILRFTPFEANSANSSHPPRAYFFHQGALTGAHKLTRPRLVTASTGPLAFFGVAHGQQKRLG